jgi:hypothetical protein
MKIVTKHCGAVAAGAAMLLALCATPVSASTIVLPSRFGYTVQIDAKGRVIPFTVEAAGMPPGATVSVEQCDGVPPSTAGWSPNQHCDSATSPAAQTVDADGTVQFTAGDNNYGFAPVAGDSPQHLFNCLVQGQPAPKNHQQSFATCQVRVASSLIDPTGDQAFLPIQFARAGSNILFPTTTIPRPPPDTSARTVHGAAHATATPASVTSTSHAPYPNAPTAVIHGGESAPPSSSPSSHSLFNRLGDAIVSVPGLLLLAAGALFGGVIYRRYRRSAQRTARAH